MKIGAFVAICVAVLVAAGGIALVLNYDNSGKGDTVTIVDGQGDEITVPYPLKKIAITNTSGAECLAVLGVKDRVVAADESTISRLNSIYGNCTNIVDYKTPTVEKIVESGAQVLIAQTGGRSLDAGVEELLENSYGIPVLRVDCYGETMFEDMKILLKALGSSDADKKYDEYVEYANGVWDSLRNAYNNLSDDSSFLFYAKVGKNARGALYTENAEISKYQEGLYGNNELKSIIGASSGSTASPDGSVILDYDGNNPGKIDVVLIRSIQDSTFDQSYNKFIGFLSDNYAQLDAIENHKVYVIETEVLSGPKEFIGFVAIAEEVFGANVEKSASDVVLEFNEKFGLTETYTDIVKCY